MIQPGSKIITMSDTNIEWLTEAEIATRLNVDRAILKKRRPHLPSGAVMPSPRGVLWTLAAAQGVADELGLSAAFQIEKTAPAQDEKTPTETLTVVSSPRFAGLHFRNPNVVQARRPNGELVLLRVGSSRNYVARLRSGEPMTVPATIMPGGNVWIRLGRDPRWPGRW